MPLVNEFDVYHDESQVAGYWHGILFVPRASRERLLSYLASGRRFTKYFDPISLKNVDKTTGRIFRCTRCWLHFGIAALIQKLKGQRHAIFTGEDRQSLGYDLLERVIGARFVLCRLRDGHTPLSGYPDHAAKVETTFRMAFKGGLKIFSDEANEIYIRSLHFDGHEHYGRGVNLRRILGRIGNLPPWVHVPDNIELDDGTSDHRKRDPQHYDDCQLLQLTDVLVGGFRTVLGQSISESQRDVSAPLLDLSTKWRQGPRRMRNSRWFRGYCISEAFLEDGHWQYADVIPKFEDRQSRLFDASAPAAS